MSDGNTKKWPQITEKTSDAERALRIRSFEIKGPLTTWKVTGIKLKNKDIVFHLAGYSNYKFVLRDGVISGSKTQVERPSDSGVLANHDSRFNLLSDKKERSTLRLSSLIKYLPEAFL